MKKPNFVKIFIWTLIISGGMGLLGSSLSGMLQAYWQMAQMGMTGPLFNYLFFGIPVVAAILAGIIYGVLFLIWKLKQKPAAKA